MLFLLVACGPAPMNPLSLSPISEKGVEANRPNKQLNEQEKESVW